MARSGGRAVNKNMIVLKRAKGSEGPWRTVLDCTRTHERKCRNYHFYSEAQGAFYHPRKGFSVVMSGVMVAAIYSNTRH